VLEAVQAQNVTRFTPQDTFEIPAVNGMIRFSFNGTYTSATLENDMWVFNNLTLGTRSLGDLKFSAKNCNVTIYTISSSANNSRQSGYIRYSVEGVGEQVVNLGFDSSKPSHPSEWTVVNQDSVFFAEGKNWQLLSDNTMIIRGLSGTLTVMRYNYGLTVDNRPFYLRHSIIILTALAVVATVTIATVIKLKTKRLP